MMTEAIDRRHAPRKRSYDDKRHDNYTTRKCTYRLLEDEKVVTITVSPKGKRMVTHKATVSSEQFDELWFSEFRHRFESDITYQRRFKMRRPPPARNDRRQPNGHQGSRDGDRRQGGRDRGFQGNDRGFQGNSHGPRRPQNGRNDRPNNGRRPPHNRGQGRSAPPRTNRLHGGYDNSNYTSDRGS
ncbi:MAG: hypothetical protein ACPG8W_03870 [Candidatus Promineifilaceae bacterium]